MKRITIKEAQDYIKLERLDDTAVAFTRELQEDGSDEVVYYKKDNSLSLSDEEIKQLMEGYN